MESDPSENPPASPLPTLDTDFFSLVIEAIADPVFIKDQSHRWVYVNQPFCDFVGYRRKELLGKSDYDFFPAEQADIFWKIDSQVFANGEVNINDETLTAEDGRLAIISTKKSILTRDNGSKFLVGVIRDITNSERRKRHHEQLTRLLQRLVLGASQEEILNVALKVAEEEIPGSIATIMFLNKKTQRLNLAIPSRLPEEFSQTIDGTPARQGMGSCGDAVFLRRPVVVEDIETHPNWQKIKDVALRNNLRACWSQPVFNFSGSVEGTFALYFSQINAPDPFDLEILETLAQFTAITIEHQRIERETHHLRILMSDMIDAMPSILIAVDHQGRVLQWNSEAEKITQINADEARGRELGSVLNLNADQLESIYQAIDDRGTLTWSKISHCWQGENRWLDLALYPVGGTSKAGSVIRIDDVTDQVRIEQMMVQTEKIHSLGGLAAGMAHEINNPLATILQSIQVIENRLNRGLKKNELVADACGGSFDLIEKYMKERDITGLIGMITEAGERASGIVSNMLDFCRKGGASIRHRNLPQLMDKTVALLDNDYNQSQRYDFRKVRICRDYRSDLAQVPCEETNLQQVFFNLLKNAAQAMVEAEVQDPTITIRMQESGRWFKIEIEDNGPGMDEETQRHIFAPFYTTKSVGIGTGLGLSVVYFIITDAHQGKITVDSRPGFGAKFIIQLPLERPDLPDDSSPE